jgi:ubiquinone/menaquinone biosynthesis C-methylase UbiE
MLSLSRNVPRIDPREAVVRQRTAWASGDYAVAGNALQIVSEELCETVNLCQDERVLDVAAGNFHASLAAARRWCEVTATDYVGGLLERARERALADGLRMNFKEADAENLPFADGSFDVVVSTFGVMFTPDQDRAASELMRVCRPGGKIGMANWTPDGFIGQLFKTIGKHLPPPIGAKSPALWGTKPRLVELFDDAPVTIDAHSRNFVFRYRSPEHWLEIFRTFYGPVLKAFAALEAEKQTALTHDLLALIERFNRSGDSSMVVPSEYLEVVITKR